LKQPWAVAGAIALGLGCAQMQEPPGGPPDFTPPKLLKVTPDSGAIVPGWREPARFTFDEVVTEPPDQAFQHLILVSPRPKSLHLGWHRTSLTVEPDGGWRPDVTYRVELLPGVSDLRNNRVQKRTTLVFSTGNAIPTGLVRGTVIDWTLGKIAQGALLEAISLKDSLTYVSVTDSSGTATIDHLAPGRYVVVGTIDQNGNQRRDGREAFDSAVVTLDTTFASEFWTFAHDTTGPRVRSVTLADSVTAKIEFSQMLANGDPDTSAVHVVALPDSTPVPIAAVMRESVFDSVALVEQKARAQADSVKRAAQADSARRAKPDTAKANPGAGPVAPRAPIRDNPTPRAARDTSRSAGADTARVNAILRKRPKLSAFWVVRFPATIPVNARYVLRATAANLTSVSQTSQAVLAGPKPPADSTAARGRGAGSTPPKPPVKRGST
jgi:hypothetical protein